MKYQIAMWAGAGFLIAGLSNPVNLTCRFERRWLVHQ